MSTVYDKILREFSSSEASLAAILAPGQWGQAQDTGCGVAMRRDGVTWDVFETRARILASYGSGSANILQMATGAGALADTALSYSGGVLVLGLGQNGPTIYSVQNTTAGTSSLAALSLASDGGLGASVFLASSAYTDDSGAASRMNIGSGGFATGINFKGYNATDTVKTFFGSAYSSGNLIHTISNKGIKLQNIALSTDADGTVAGVEHLFSLTKNDGNTRQFYGYKILATLNAGGSNSSTTLDLASVDTVNAAVTGLTVNLLHLKYGGSSKFRLDSLGNLGLGGMSAGGGQGIAFLANAAATPGSNPTGGGVLYAEAGALKWRGSSGTITTIAAA